MVNYLKHLPVAIAANIVYGFPSRKALMVGVTGTEGKTTTVNLIYHLLQKSGIPVAEVSTVSAKVGPEEIDTGLHVTSLGSFELQKLIKAAVDQRINTVILEMTSHGLDQFRFWGVKFRIGVLTNINREHMDYHKNFDNYTKVKLGGLLKSHTVVLNKDDGYFDYFYKQLSGRGIKVITYGINNRPDFMAENIRIVDKKTEFILKTDNNKISVSVPIIGQYNVYNILAALAVADNFGIDIKKATDYLSDFILPEGRLQEVGNKLGIKIFIDFAHTPNALKEVLSTLKKLTPKTNKLITVFGSAGKRDAGKRPAMGEEAAKFADYVILTADDPRNENIRDISSQIVQGCIKAGMIEISKDGQNKKGFILIDDRKTAIEKALSMAKRGDIVAICGKGHEKSLAIGDDELPWSDFKAINDLLTEKEAK